MRTSWSLASALALALLTAGCGEPAGQRVSFGGSERTEPGASEPSPAAAVTEPATPARQEPGPLNTSAVAGPDATPAPAPATPATTPAGRTDEPRELGADEQAEIGRHYRYRLYTHCGIHHTWWNGAWWNADPALDNGHGSPPPGWGDPFQDGVIVQVSPSRLEFTSDHGPQAIFVPRPAAEGAPPPCD